MFVESGVVGKEEKKHKCFLLIDSDLQVELYDLIINDSDFMISDLNFFYQSSVTFLDMANNFIPYNHSARHKFFRMGLA